jgi:hypothetical protein
MHIRAKYVWASREAIQRALERKLPDGKIIRLYDNPEDARWDMIWAVKKGRAVLMPEPFPRVPAALNSFRGVYVTIPKRDFATMAIHEFQESCVIATVFPSTQWDRGYFKREKRKRLNSQQSKNIIRR